MTSRPPPVASAALPEGDWLPGAMRIALYTLLGEVQGWAGGRPADDDQTLILARVR